MKATLRVEESREQQIPNHLIPHLSTITVPGRFAASWQSEPGRSYTVLHFLPRYILGLNIPEPPT